MAHDTRQNHRPLQISMQEAALYALLSALITIATGFRTLQDVLAGGLLNPDSFMRLVRLEAALHQHDLGYIVSRDGSGSGTLLHWSHLLDLLICVLALPLRLLMDWHAALHAAAVAFGPLSMAALGVALAWAAAPLADRRWLWLAPVMAALSPSIVSYGLPGVAHHHVLLVVVAVMTSGYAMRGALGAATTRGGLAMGAWAGVGIWLSPETMPFSLMAFGGLWLAWLAGTGRHDVAHMIRTTGIGFLLVVAAAFAVDPPYAGYRAVEIDRISKVYLLLAFAICMVSCAAMEIDRLALRSWPRWAVWLGVPALYLGVWIGLFPDVIRGPNGLMSAADTHAFLDGISEMLPVRSAGEGIELLLTGSLSALVLSWLCVTRRSLLIGYAAICAWNLVLLGGMHIRFTAYATAMAAVMLPVVITRCTAWLINWTKAVQASARIAVMALFVLLPRAEALPLWSPARAAAGEADPNCSLAASGAMLADHAGQVVLADPGDTPELLYRTQVLTVGSLYHRNVPAFMRQRAAWRSMPADTVPDAVRQTGATLVLFCRSHARSLMVADLPPDTLLDRLSRGEVPRWLHQVAADRQSGNALYEVAR